MPTYIDIHSHTNFKVFDEDRDEVIKRALNNDTWIINVGTQIDTSRKAVEISNKYKEGVYAIVGLHPIHTGASYHDMQELGSEGQEFNSRGEIFNKDSYRELLKDPKVVGIGECGLDYYRCDEESIEKQKVAFIAQIELANEFNKPLMLHIRNNPARPHESSGAGGDEDKNHNAYADALEILKQNAIVKGDVHFFAGTLEDAQSFIDFGFTISFTGAITFPTRKDGKGCNYEEIIKEIPIEMIMSETDSPYVAPIPHRGERNESVYVSEVVKKIAYIKGLPLETVSKILIENAKRVFKI